MERSVYDQMADQENDHWWFRGRRAVVAQLLAGLELPGHARILDAGCGSGGNLPLLAKFGALDAFELDPDARSRASARGIVSVKPGSLPDGVPEGGPYDAIVLLDVLEHIDEDVAALKALRKRLARRGRLLITVPAGSWLWSSHDVSHHHFRRYSRARLSQVIQGAGLAVEDMGHMNTLLYPLAVAQRLWMRVSRSESSLDTPPAAWLNSTFETVYSAERHLVRKAPMPFGLSLWAIAAVPEASRLDVRA